MFDFLLQIIYAECSGKTFRFKYFYRKALYIVKSKVYNYKKYITVLDVLDCILCMP